EGLEEPRVHHVADESDAVFYLPFRLPQTETNAAACGRRDERRELTVACSVEGHRDLPIAGKVGGIDEIVEARVGLRVDAHVRPDTQMARQIDHVATVGRARLHSPRIQ